MLSQILYDKTQDIGNQGGIKANPPERLDFSLTACPVIY
jgi:hypothetical protein